ncbi:MAG TPA: hypothetical protein PLU80_16520 [Acidobacteriota bacterium]|nr:hypothetical protein [Acidobacteriota bacterium]HNC45774.1 hypothetical protein [Acidobacteriota bacterium]
MKSKILGLMLVVFLAGCTRSVPDDVPLPVANPSPNVRANPDNKRVMDNFSPLEGTPLIYARIVSADSGYEFNLSSGKGGPNIHNYVFVNPDNLSSQMLLPVNNYFIHSMEGWPQLAKAIPTEKQKQNLPKDEPLSMPPPEKAPGKNTKPEGLIATPESAEKKVGPKCFLYRVTKYDTDGDEILTGKDEETLGISNPDGSGFVEVIPGIHWTYWQSISDDGILVIAYQTGKQKKMARIDVLAKRIIQQVDVNVGSDVK